MRNVKNILIELASGKITNSYYDLDTIIKMICKIEDGNKYDVLIHRFFEGERNNSHMPKGWFCHIQVYNYDTEKEDWYKNDQESVKVFGCISPKQSVIRALKMLLKVDIE